MSSPASPNAAAAITSRGNTLFVHYTASSADFGTLYTLSPPSSTPNAGGNSNTPSLLNHPQTFAFGDPIPLNPSQPITSASMVSTATASPNDSAVHHNLLLALNTPTGPFLLQLEPQFPNIGDGQTSGKNTNNMDTSTWKLTDKSATLKTRLGADRVWLSSGQLIGDPMTGTVPLEGSAIFQLVGSKTSNIIQKLDVSAQSPGIPLTGWPVTQTFLDNTLNPKIIRVDPLTNNQNSGIGIAIGTYDAVIVGDCQTSTGTCVEFISDSAFAPLMTKLMYDPTSCIAAYNDVLFMATTDNIWTLPFPNIMAVPQWTARQPPSFAPKLPSPILACTTVNSTLFAVLKGKASSPAIYSVDLAKANLDWQEVQLVTVSPVGGSNGNKPNPNDGVWGGGSGSGSASKGLSGGIITAIAVVAILAVVLSIVALLLRRRRNQEASNQDQVEKGVSGAATPVGSPPPFSPTHPSLYSSAAGSTVAGLPQYSAAHSIAPLAKQEVSPNSNHRGPPHMVSRDWSHGSLTSGTAHPSSSQQPYSHAPYPSNNGSTVGEPLSTTTMPSGSVYAPSSPPRTNVIVGDKQELESESQSPPISYLQPVSSTASPAGSPTTGTAPDPRQAMISPGLANAQLILQHSQSPATTRTEGGYR
ncbi:MAG: hypothetical protein J3Q66DRAFT_195564 [Benniella sp.]|nr:MAG: hypothetical protein J3Q66DRAFT_195564 [Benniella sp.]